jgi:hypothetical protein
MLLAAACQSTGTVQNTSGGYMAVAPWYQTRAGVLYATDGEHWYVLKRPEVQGGYVNGAQIGTAEQWVRVGESRTRAYQRTAGTFRDQSKRPVFIPY